MRGCSSYLKRSSKFMFLPNWWPCAVVNKAHGCVSEWRFWVTFVWVSDKVDGCVTSEWRLWVTFVWVSDKADGCVTSEWRFPLAKGGHGWLGLAGAVIILVHAHVYLKVALLEIISKHGAYSSGQIYRRWYNVD
jgi:hypothetical protein